MRALLAFVCLLSLAAAADASETLTYTYDALGRLVQVARSGTVNNGKNSCYSLDKANNRTNLTIGTSPCPGGSGGGPSFSINNVAATEGSPLIFTITKSGTASGTTTVDYATANGTATAGSDYTAKSGTLSFLISDTSKTVSVTTTNDTTAESNETVLLNLSNATGGATISDSQGVGTINDNDGGGGGGNQPPITNPDTAVMSCGDIIFVDVVANDTDPDGNLPLSLVSASGSPGIIVTVFSSTEIRIVSNGSSSGVKTFSYVVQDSLGAQSAGSGTVTVNAPCN